MGPIQGPYILQLYMGPVPHTFGGLTPPPYFAQWLVRSRSPETAGNVTRPLPLGLSETPFLSALPRRQSILMPLQRAQNAAARLVLGLDRRSHTTAALQDLHRLPVKYRITFKIAPLMHQVLHQRCPICTCPTSSSSTLSALSGDFVPQSPELLSFNEPGLSSDGGPSLFVVQTFGILSPQLFVPWMDSYPAFRRSLKHTYLGYFIFFKLVPIRVFIIDNVG